MGYIEVIGEVDVKGATTHPFGDGKQFSQPVLRLQAVQYCPHPIILNIIKLTMTRSRNGVVNIRLVGLSTIRYTIGVVCWVLTTPCNVSK